MEVILQVYGVMSGVFTGTFKLLSMLFTLLADWSWGPLSASAISMLFREMKRLRRSVTLTVVKALAVGVEGRGSFVGER